MSTTFSVPCKNCGNPIMITVQEGTAGGVLGICRRCSHSVSVSYSFSSGNLNIHNVL